jgi:hypothetical protein
MKTAMPGKFTLNADVQPDVLEWGELHAEPSALHRCHATRHHPRQHLPSPGSRLPLPPQSGRGPIRHLRHPRAVARAREGAPLARVIASFIPPGVAHASFKIGADEPRVLTIFGPPVGDAGLEMVEVSGEEPCNGLRANATK